MADEYRVAKIKKTMGHEGPGFLCDVMCGKRIIGHYADYGDGAMGNFDFIKKEEQQPFADYLRTHLEQIYDDECDSEFQAMHDAERTAFVTGNTVEWEWEPGDKRTETFQQAMHSAIETWINNVVVKISRTKDCEKGILYCQKDQTWKEMLWNVPYTQANVQKLIDENFGGDASKVTIYNEVLGFPFAGPLEAFLKDYSKIIKEENSGKKMLFRPLGSDEQGTIQGRWYQTNTTGSLAEQRTLINSGRQFAGKNLEWRADILQQMEQDIKREMTQDKKRTPK